MKKVTSWDALEYFRREEFSAPDLMSFDFLIRLDAARRRAGIPFVLTSTFRAGDPGSHGLGLAADIAVDTSKQRWKCVEAAIYCGFTRIGVYRDHVHVDIDPQRAQDVLWYGMYHPETKEVSHATQENESKEE